MSIDIRLGSSGRSVPEGVKVRPESGRTRIARWLFNLFPAYRGTGARIRYIAADYLYVHVAIPLSWRTRNYVGTTFGGSLYGAADPVYMVMLIKNLGPDFSVWVREGRIRYLRPGRGTLHAHFALSAEEIAAIREEARSGGAVKRLFETNLVDEDATPHAVVEQVLYVRAKGQDGHAAAGSSDGSVPPPGS